jgi:hypothetical protein
MRAPSFTRCTLRPEAYMSAEEIPAASNLYWHSEFLLES